MAVAVVVAVAVAARGGCRAVLAVVGVVVVVVVSSHPCSPQPTATEISISRELSGAVAGEAKCS